MKILQALNHSFFRHVPNLLILAGFLAFFIPLQAKAQVIDLEKIPPIVEVEEIPDDVFEAQTALIRQMPFEDQFLEHTVRIPKDWKLRAAKPRDSVSVEDSIDALEGVEKSAVKLFGTFAEYVSPPKNQIRSFFTLEALELGYEIEAQHWFVNYIFSQGYSLEALSVISKTQAEGLYVQLIDNTTYLVRVMAFINGPRIVLARYYVAQEHYMEERALQAKVVKSFQLTNIDTSGIEVMESFSFLNEAFFDYPASWYLIPSKIKTIARMKATLVQSKNIDSLSGQISMFLVSKIEKTTLQEEIEDFKTKLEIPDYSLGRYLGPETLDYHSDIYFGATEVYEMKPDVVTQIDYELWVSVMESDGYYIIASLLTPGRGAEFYTWAQNQEAYKHVVATIRQYDETLTAPSNQVLDKESLNLDSRK
ncbi:MAG: hypothetical protein GW903_03970 [Alphaproteobacteria bacterium]|nr:hypothetical protein [Alphaproteobacteria bacterium]NCQ88125.1 hypothetical protein [Alphaproteobacteria bacterium]NCT05368.1 hypothetical protein [Alphaproteobacteria bacterium]